MSTSLNAKLEDFYPRSPCGERRNAHPDIRQPCAISIHALLAESDALRQLQSALRRDFYPRSPCGERLKLLAERFCDALFLSTLSLRRATVLRIRSGNAHTGISIHALLAESDGSSSSRSWQQKRFLSTLSLRRATHRESKRGPGGCISIHALLAESDVENIRHKNVRGDFYPRSPCGERRFFCRALQNKFPISIHALLAESDTPRLSRVVPTPIFLSTLSLRRATETMLPSWTRYAISIHALLAESDCVRFVPPHSDRNFYPRSPCGERPQAYGDGARNTENFYPRSPCGERPADERAYHQLAPISIHALLAESDQGAGPCRQKRGISIHALLAESDPTQYARRSAHMYFYPRSPCGERPSSNLGGRSAYQISIHALLAESDPARQCYTDTTSISIHALLAESDHSDAFAAVSTLLISIHALLAESDPRRHPGGHLGHISIHALLAESDPLIEATTE